MPCFGRGALGNERTSRRKITKIDIFLLPWAGKDFSFIFFLFPAMNLIDAETQASRDENRKKYKKIKIKSLLFRLLLQARKTAEEQKAINHHTFLWYFPFRYISLHLDISPKTKRPNKKKERIERLKLKHFLVPLDTKEEGKLFCVWTCFGCFCLFFCLSEEEKAGGRMRSCDMRIHLWIWSYCSCHHVPETHFNEFSHSHPRDNPIKIENFSLFLTPHLTQIEATQKKLSIIDQDSKKAE